MEMTSTRIVNAPPDEVWAALNDPTVLKDAIPGCETLERTTETDWRVVVAAKVGPVAARFNGRITLTDLNPPTAYTMKFEGQGGAAGFANGEAKVALAFLGPLIVMLTKGNESAYVRRQAVESLNFQLSILIYGIVSFILIFVVVGLFLLPVVGLMWLVFTIIGSVRASKGEEYRYPLTIRMVS